MTDYIVLDRPALPTDVRRSVALYGSPVAGSKWPELVNHIFTSLGLPRHVADGIECPSLEARENSWMKRREELEWLGSCLTTPIKLQAVPLVDVQTSAALATGCINTTFLRPYTSFPSHSFPSTSHSPAFIRSFFVHVGTNTDCTAVTSVLLSALLSLPSPFPPSAPRRFSQRSQATAFVIGGGGAVRAAIYSLSHDLGCSPIFVINRSEEETNAVVAHFPSVNLRPLTSVEEAERELEELEKGGGRAVCGVGAVPCYRPETEEEKKVYEVARAVFGMRYAAGGVESEEDGLKLPDKPIFVDMAYKPRYTLFRTMAEENGWQTRCGSEFSLENAFEQVTLWTGLEISSEVRESTRRLLDE